MKHPQILGMRRQLLQDDAVTMISLSEDCESLVTSSSTGIGDLQALLFLFLLLCLDSLLRFVPLSANTHESEVNRFTNKLKTTQEIHGLRVSRCQKFWVS